MILVFFSFYLVPLALNHRPDVSLDNIMNFTVPKQTPTFSISTKLSLKSNILWQLCLATKDCTWTHPFAAIRNKHHDLMPKANEPRKLIDLTTITLEMSNFTDTDLNLNNFVSA